VSKADLSSSRRALLAGAAAARSALGTTSWRPALAKAPLLDTQAPYFYCFKWAMPDQR
jgi:hypothetical protein